MSRVTAVEYQEKQARNLKNATADIKRGVERVTESPTKKAAEKVDKWKAGIDKAYTDGKYVRGCSRVTLEDWRDKTITKGIPRIATGIDGAKDKVIHFAEQLLPYQDQIKNEIDKMDDLTLEDSIARMTHQVRRMSEFQYK